MPRKPKPPPPMTPTGSPFVAIGTSGLRQAGGFVSAEFRSELQGQNGIKIYSEMAANDPMLAGILFAITMMIRKTEWRVEAADDSAAAAAAQEWLEDELFVQLETPWSNILAEIATMFTYGFAPMEIVYRKRPDGDIGLAKLSLRNPETLWRWEFERGTTNLLGMWQLDWYSGQPPVLIPTERMCLFRTDTRYENPEGLSILRGCYIPWVRKKAIEEAEGRAALRAAGIVVIDVPAKIMRSDASAEEKKLFNSYKAVLDLVATDRQGGLIMPSDVNPDSPSVRQYDMRYVVADGNRPVNMTDALERIDKRMASTVLADFILLGQQSVGSFALSSDKSQLFLETLQAWNNLIADTLDREFVRRLWKLRGEPDETRPKLVPADVSRPNLTEMGGFIRSLAAAGMPLFPDERLESTLRAMADLPEPSPEVRDRAEAEHDAAMQAIAGSGLPSPAQPGGGDLMAALRARASALATEPPEGDGNGKKPKVPAQ